MKKILPSIIATSVLLVACASGSNSPGSNDATTGNASFSCVIDGRTVSGGQISNIQGAEGYQSDQAHIVDVDQGKELLFYLSDPASASVQAVHSLRFAVPNKAGHSSFGPEENGWGIETDIVVSKDHTAQYFSDSFTMDITTLTATRVSGTFSGKFKLRGNVNDTDKQEMAVTDGKFDIPLITNP